MVFQIISIIYLTVLVAIILVLFSRNTESHKTVMKIAKDAAELIGGFRQEMHKAIDSAIEAHVKKYHSKSV